MGQPRVKVNIKVTVNFLKLAVRGSQVSPMSSSLDFLLLAFPVNTKYKLIRNVHPIPCMSYSVLIALLVEAQTIRPLWAKISLPIPALAIATLD